MLITTHKRSLTLAYFTWASNHFSPTTSLVPNAVTVRVHSGCPSAVTTKPVPGSSLRLREQALLPVFHFIASELVPKEVNVVTARRVMLVGDAQSGKSTWLRQLAFGCAKHTRIEEVDAVTFPLYLDDASSILTLLERYGYREDSVAILQKYVRDTTRKELSFKVQQLLHEAISRQKYWLIVDCLDKISPENAKVVVTWLAELAVAHRHARLAIGSASMHLALQLRRELDDKGPAHGLEIWTLEEPLSREATRGIISSGSDSSQPVPLVEELEQELPTGASNFFQRDPYTAKLLGKIHMEALRKAEMKTGDSQTLTSMVEVRYMQRALRELTILQFDTLAPAEYYDLLERVAFHLQCSNKLSATLESLADVLTQQQFDTLARLHKLLLSRSRPSYLLCLEENSVFLSGSKASTREFAALCFTHVGFQRFLAAQHMAKLFISVVRNTNKDAYRNPESTSRINTLVEDLLFAHYAAGSYRLCSSWWHPVVFVLFDMLLLFDMRKVKLEGVDRLSKKSCLLGLIVGHIVKRHDTVIGMVAAVPASNSESFLAKIWLSAAAAGKVALLEFLTYYKPAAELMQFTDADGNSALHLAAKFNRAKVIEALIIKPGIDGSHLDRNNKYGWDPSNMAMVFNHTRCFRLLCFTEGDKIAGDDDPCKRSYLITLCCKGNVDAVKVYLQKKSLEADKENNRYSSQSQKVSQLTSAKQKKPVCNINARGSSGMTAAMWASRKGFPDVLETLIEYGADVKLPLAGGLSTLMFAVEGGHVRCVELLLNAGACPRFKSLDGDSALLCACSFGYDEVTKALINAGESALEGLVVSCVQGRDSTVKSLIKANLADINQVWKDLSVSPLAGACVAGHQSTVELLLRLGADPNVDIDVEYGSSALMLAVHMGNIEIVRALLQAGADVNKVSPEHSDCSQTYGPHVTAVRIAQINGFHEIEALLRNYGGHLYVPCTLTWFLWLGGKVDNT